MDAPLVSRRSSDRRVIPTKLGKRWHPTQVARNALPGIGTGRGRVGVARPLRIFGYGKRVSSEAQAGTGSSLRDQETAIRRGRERRVHKTTVRPHTVRGGKVKPSERSSESREQIQSLLREVRHGDLVVCDKIDRVVA